LGLTTARASDIPPTQIVISAIASSSLSSSLSQIAASDLRNSRS
jgi:hypothetical protein